MSYIRVLHASPNAPAVDIYANDKLIIKDLAYRNLTYYIFIKPGEYNIEVYPAGKKNDPVVSTFLQIPAKSIFTVAAIGLLPDIELLPVPDKIMPTRPNKAYVRFVHLSPNAPDVDITLPDGKILFSNVPYKGITEYIAVDPGTYTLQARVAGTNSIVLRVPHVMLKADKFYTAYAIGLVGEKPPLQLITTVDGNSYLSFD